MSAPVEVRGASKWYGAVIGINEVDLDLAPGITGLLGPNGAGKSTLIKLIAGTLRPSLGEVRVFGLPAATTPAARAAIGYLPEVDGFYEDLSGREFVRSMARLTGLRATEARERTEKVLVEVGMQALAKKRLKACSKGMRQRIKLAQALVHDPQVLILDEPLSGIDVAGRRELMDLFRRFGAAGKTVLVSTHILEEIEEITDRIVLMAGGRVLASGTVGSIRDLLDEHPLTVRIVATRARELAADLLSREEVTGVAVGDVSTVAIGGKAGDGIAELTVKVKAGDRFFRAFPALALARGAEVKRIEPLDASAEAIFQYLIGGKS